MQERGYSKIIFTKFMKYPDLHVSLLNINDMLSPIQINSFTYYL